MATMPWQTIAKREHDGRPAAVPAGAHPVGQQAETEDHQAEGDGERELAGHRRLEVAAVDAEALVEREAQPGEGEQLRHRVAEAGQTAERPAAERQHDEPGDGDELERHAVREERVEGDDGQRRDDHVEAVDRHPGVPVHAPARTAGGGSSRLSRRNAGPHTWAPMSPPVGVVSVEDQVGARVERVEVDDVHHHDGRDEQRQRRDDDTHDALGRPRRLGPAHRTAHDAAPGPRRPRRRPWLAAGSSSHDVETRRRRRPSTTSSSARAGASTTATDDSWSAHRRRGRPASPRSAPSFIATGNDGSPRAGFVGHRTASSRPGRVERDVGRHRHAEAAGDQQAGAGDEAERRTAPGTRRAGSG